MLDVLTLQLQALRAETFELLSDSKSKASKSEIEALYERYSEGLYLLKKIAINLETANTS